ncbi:MAG: hypothetical protein IJX72_04025 [Clostridia bacterium]|nr:hypothetical protein [Clostridia bacterium]
MPPKAILVEGAVTPAEALRFAAIADEVIASPKYRMAGRTARVTDDGSPHIGTLREKRLHAAIKLYLCPDEACHERPVAELVLSEDATVAAKKRRMVADILMDFHIMEVQTGGFYPLKEKISWYLTHTPCRVTVIHPIPAVRYLSWINPEDGTIISRRKSPKRGRVKDVAKELYWLSEFIGNPRFSLRLLLVELEEYRMADGWSRDGKRGSNRYERFPTALLGDVTLSAPADYAAYFLPAALSSPAADGVCPLFTAAEYSKLTGIRGKATYSTVHLMERLGLITETEEKIGRSKTYRVLPRREAGEF